MKKKKNHSTEFGAWRNSTYPDAAADPQHDVPLRGGPLVQSAASDEDHCRGGGEVKVDPDKSFKTPEEQLNWAGWTGTDLRGLVEVAHVKVQTLTFLTQISSDPMFSANTAGGGSNLHPSLIAAGLLVKNKHTSRVPESLKKR